MEISVLDKMSDQQLKDLASSLKVKESFMVDRDHMIRALRTYPNNANCLNYVDVTQPEDIVAFRTDQYAVKSAKVIRKSTKDEKLMLETVYGRRYVVDFSDVLWVNTNGYWPKWIYNLMKENENAEADNAE